MKLCEDCKRVYSTGFELSGPAAPAGCCDACGWPLGMAGGADPGDENDTPRKSKTPWTDSIRAAIEQDRDRPPVETGTLRPSMTAGQGLPKDPDLSGLSGDALDFLNSLGADLG